jgi:polysaccharide export outer membrane protein
MTICFLRSVAIASIAFLSNAGSLSGQEATLKQESARATVEVPNGPQLEQRYPRYVIQRQDVLLLSFPLSPEMNQTITVQPDGYINLLNAGSVHVQGMTVPDVAAAVKHAYAGVLNNPIVTVDLQDFQKPFFTVTGQVGKPGQYELRSDITVAEAVAVAGGMLATAKTQQVFLLHRSTNDWFKVEKIDLRDILNGKKVDEDAFIRPGDMVFVPESAITKFRKYVPYSANAGSYLSETP